MNKTPLEQLIERLGKLQALYKEGEPQHNAFGIAIDEAQSILPQERNQKLNDYWAGFNQAHYSHMHPDLCPPKECEQAGYDYFTTTYGKGGEENK